MQPTTDTPFERFAFTTVIWFAFLLPLTIALVPGVLIMTIDPKNVGAIVPIISIAATLVALALPVFCILCAMKIERDHLKALAQVEDELSDIVVSDMRTLPSNWQVTGTVFIVESVVLANDYFKAFRWWFRKIVGGESKSYSKLLSRARREATVRVLRKARDSGANVVWNIRYETSVVRANGARDGTNSITGVEILAYATAFNVMGEHR